MTSSGRQITISVIGAGAPSPETYKAAVVVGREIAKGDGVLVCGGLGGVMEAACRGASREGGLTVGIIPGTDREEANRWVKVVIATGLGHARNVLVVQSGEAVVALPGKEGTLSEIAFALINGRPVVGVGAWGEIEGVVVEKTPEEAVKRAFLLAGERR